MDQMSTEWSYSEAFKITSGALYHLVTTYSVSMVSSQSNPLESPRSQIFKSQFLLRRRLEGFKSLWMTKAECIFRIPLKIW